MNEQEVCRLLLDALGGKENIRSNNACMTRLRVGVHDLSRVDLEALRAVEGVLGVVEADTLQIVFGPGKVNKVLDAFVGLTGIPKGADAGTNTDVDVRAAARENKAEQNARRNGLLQNLLKRVANVFVPLLPGIIAAGLVNGLTNVINVSTGGSLSGLWWYECIRSVGWALFAYLPIFAGYNAAREFGGSPVLGGVAGALCVANPAMPLLAASGDVQVTLPMTGAAYNPSSGGLLAALFAGALIAWLEQKVRTVMPEMIDTFATPLVALVVGALALVAVVQPVSAVLMQGIYTVMNVTYEGMGAIGGYLLAAGFLPLVSIGLHQALTPIHVMLNDPAGPTAGINYLLPVLMMAGGGQVGAGCALYLKTSNAKLKGYIRDSVPVGILGVGEPLMYAVTLPLGKPFICACLGSGFGGALATLLHIGTVSQGVSGLFGLLIVVPGQQLPYVAAMAVACVAGFVITWFFGVDEARIREVYGAS